jgi:hypothetical protein
MTYTISSFLAAIFASAWCGTRYGMENGEQIPGMGEERRLSQQKLAFADEGRRRALPIDDLVLALCLLPVFVHLV